MDEIRESLRDGFEAWQEDGRLYLVVGVIAVLIAGFVPPVGTVGFVIPVACLVGAFCGVRLYVMDAFKLAGAVLVLFAIGVALSWISIVTA